MADLTARPDHPFAGRYATERELGRGGMATVYLARDLVERRQVAIKVFHPELLASLGPARFLREIAMAADLTHPNILPLHESGEADGLLYYVTPFVEAGSLRGRLQREIQLPLDEALRITRDIAEALDYAHTAGLVHRDVKPENILLAGSSAVLADFGVARAVEAAAVDRLTESGLAVGTPAYMSPEQAGGSERLDGRSDIYSLACVLYEMLAGEPPFTAPTAQALVAKHLQQRPVPLHIIRETIPLGVEQAVERALAKVPADRFSTATRFAEALEMSATGIAQRSLPATRIPRIVRVVAILTLCGGALGLWWLGLGAKHRSPGADSGFDPARIAVLYFEDRTGDSTVRQIADGLTEDLIRELSGVNAFRVISRGGVRPYRGRQVPFDSMVAALRATVVVDGSVQRSGDRLRVRVDLIDAKSDTYVDSLSLERPLSDFLSLEREVAQQVAFALRRQMGREVRLKGALAGTRSARARELVLRAQSARDDAEELADHPDVRDLRTAIDALGRAESLLALAQAEDPAWLQPLILRGWSSQRRAALLSGRPRHAALDASLAFAEQAVQRAPENPEVLELRGTVLWELVTETQSGPNDSTWLRQSEADLRKATDLDSTMARAWATLSYLQWFKGSTGDAQLSARRALREDAYMADARSVFNQLFFADLMLPDFPQAAEWCRRGRLSFPNHWRFVECELTLMRHDVHRAPDPDSAWTLVRELDRLDPAAKAKAEGRAYHTIYRRVVAATISARAGQHALARAELARARSSAKPDSILRVDLLYDEAYLWLVLGDTGRARTTLREYTDKRPMTREYLARDSLFNGLPLAP